MSSIEYNVPGWLIVWLIFLGVLSDYPTKELIKSMYFIVVYNECLCFYSINYWLRPEADIFH